MKLSSLVVLIAVWALQAAVIADDRADHGESDGPAASQPAGGQEAIIDSSSGDWLSWKKMTGNWNGVRTEMVDKGIILELDVTQVLQGNAHGGRDTTNGLRYSGSGDLTLTIDTGKAGLWPAGTIVLNAEPKWGNGINEKVGSLLPVNYDGIKPNVEPCTMTLSEYFIVQGIYQGPIGKAAIAMGKADLARLFDTNVFANDERTQFMNLGLRNNPLISPLAQYAGGAVALIYLPTDWLTILTAAGDSSGSADRTMSSTAFHGPADDMGVGHEWSFEIRPFGQVGHQRVGFGWSGTDRSHVNPVTPFKQAAGPLVSALGLDTVNLLAPLLPTELSGDTWLFYYNFDQYIMTEEVDPTQGVGLFGRFGYAPEDVNAANAFYSIGIGGKGIIDTRDNDSFGVGYYHLNLSDRLPPQLHSEQGVECYYSIEVAPWLHITPDLQVIVDPGGTSGEDCALVYGVRTQISF